MRSSDTPIPAKVSHPAWPAPASAFQDLEYPASPKDRDWKSASASIVTRIPRYRGPAPMSSSPRGFDLGDVDLLHLHHRVHGAFRSGRIGIGDGLHQGPRSDLPAQPKLILAPPAHAL